MIHAEVLEVLPWIHCIFINVCWCVHTVDTPKSAGALGKKHYQRSRQPAFLTIMLQSDVTKNEMQIFFYLKGTIHVSIHPFT